MKIRDPLDPPYTKSDIPALDVLHDAIGIGVEWGESERRKEILETPDPEGVSNL